MKSIAILLLLLLAVAGAHAQSRSFCDRYTDILFGSEASLYAGNQTKLIRAVVYRAEFGCSPSPPPGAFYPQDACAAEVAFDGILAPHSPILDVFQGKVPYKPNPTDFTDPLNVNMTLALVDKLVAFFGNALGCTSPDFPVFPTFLHQGRIHDGMRITQEGFNFFNSRVLASMRSFGVSEKDINYIAKPFLISFGACSAQPICQDVTVCELGTGIADANCKARYDATLVRDYEVETDRKRWTVSFIPSMISVVLIALMFYVFYFLAFTSGGEYKAAPTSSGRKK